MVACLARLNRAQAAPGIFLFLQGPLSPLYRRIGARLAKAGHRVTRVNFCVGDWLHWHGRECRFWRGTVADWPAERRG